MPPVNTPDDDSPPELLREEERLDHMGDPRIHLIFPRWDNRTPVSATQIDWQCLDYVHPVDQNLLCAICKTAFYKPKTTFACRHTFCKLCLEQHLATLDELGREPSCPTCRDWLVPVNGNFSWDADRIYTTLLDELEVRCPAKLCHWTGQRGSLEKHVTTCERVLVACVDENCEGLVMRGSQEECCLHYEDVCALCQEVIEMAQQYEHRSTICPMVTVNCTICQDSMERRDLTSHMVLCATRIFTCKFQDMGCEYRDSSSKVTKHQETCQYGRLLIRLECRLLANLDLKSAFHRVGKQIRDVEDRVAAIEGEIADMRAEPPDPSTMGFLSDPERLRSLVSRLNYLLGDGNPQHNMLLQHEVRPIKYQLADVRGQIGILCRRLYQMQRSVNAFSGASNNRPEPAPTGINDGATISTTTGQPLHGRATSSSASNSGTESISAGVNEVVRTPATTGRPLNGRNTPPRPSL